MSGLLEGLKIANGLVQGIAIAVKGVELADSGIAIHGLITKKNRLNAEEKAQLAAEIAYAVFTTCDIAASGTYLIGSHVSPSHAPLFKNIRITTSVLTGVASVRKAWVHLYFKKELKTDDIAHVVGVIIFQFTDLAEATSAEPKFCGTLQTASEATYAIGNLAGSALLAYSSRRKLQAGAVIIAKWWAKLLNERKALPPAGAAATAVADQVPALFPAPGVDPESVAEFYENVVNLMITNWRQLPEIPEDLRGDPILKKFICPITRVPVRFAFSPVSHNKIVYEREKLREYLRAGEVPPQWPQGLPFHANNMQENELAQHLINSSLEEIADEWRTARQNLGRNTQ